MRAAVLTALIVAAVAAWSILPFPLLIEPDGPYDVGTTTFRWVDQSRAEFATSDPADKRNVILQVFYPVAKGTTGTPATYMDGLHDLPSSVSIMPRFLLKNFGRAATHAINGAPVASDRRRWPVVVFSPGYGAPRSFYTTLITGLTSRGFAVLAIDHPYEAGVAELADGRVVTTSVRRLPNDPNLVGYMAIQQDLRVADIHFALDQLARVPLAPHLDPDRIAAIGHSFGGASSIAAMAHDKRIQAAVNIDGTPYGSLPGMRIERPVMVIESDPALGKHGEAYRAGNQMILNNLSGASGYRYTLPRTNHYSFSDFPLFFSPPGRWLLSLAIGGFRDPRETYSATLDLLTAFLNDPADLERVAARYEWIAGGRLK